MRWQKWAIVAAVVALGVLLFALAAQGAEPPKNLSTLPQVGPVQKLTMTVEGQVQGKIKGANRDGSFGLIFYTHEIVSPRDPASGLPTGKRQHKPFVVRKEIDKTSPLLAKVLVNNENLKTVELRVNSAAGSPTYIIKLTNANIASLHQLISDDGTPVEEIAFTYQKIQWTWTDGGITSDDDWESPVQ